MAITVKHKFVSAIPDAGDTTIVQPSNWNDDHDLVGTVPVANGGTGATTLTGYVIGNGSAAMTASTTIPNTAVTGLGTMSTQNANAVAITGGTITGVTVSGYIPYTGASSAIDLNAQTVTNIAHLGINSTAVPDILLRAYGDNNSTSRIGIRGYSSNTSSSSMRIAKFRGTFASPQAPLSGDSLGKFELAGYGTTSSSGYPQASYEGVATENWGAIARGTKALFYVTPNTTITQAVALTLDQDKTATFASTVTATTFSGSGASLTSIPNSALVNSAITINGTSTSLGGSISVGTVTSVGGTGTVNGISLSGTVTSSGNLTLGGTLDLSSPPTIGNTAPNTGKFTTLQATGNTTLGTASTTYVTITGDASYPMIQATGGTNTPLVLSPLGTGALQAQKTDSTATGGNARGANAVDWQTLRASAGQVASGGNSVIAGGYGNTAGGFGSAIGGGYTNSTSVASYASIFGGFSNTASGYLSTLVGGQSNSSLGYYNFIGGGFTNSGTSASVVTTQTTTIAVTAGTTLYLSATNANIKVGQVVTGTGVPTITYATSTVTTGTAAVMNTSTISGTTLTVGSLASGTIIAGMVLTGTGVTAGTYIVSGSGLSWTVSVSQTVSSTTITGTAYTFTISQNATTAAGVTLSFYTPHGVVVGGGNNQATGSYSFIGGGGDAGTAANRNIASGDWSVVGGGLKNLASGTASFVGSGGISVANSITGNTASGTSSVVAGGYSNTASGTATVVVGGQNNLASGSLAISVGGAYGTTRAIQGYTVFAASNVPITSSQGVNQSALLVLARETTDATATVLTSNTSAASGTNQVILPNNSAYYFKGSVISTAQFSLATTATAGAAGTATITFAAQTVAPFVVGQTIVVAGVTPTGYNGTFTVTACTTTTVQYANATTGAQTVAGTITATSLTKAWSVEGAIMRTSGVAGTRLIGTPVINIIAGDTGTTAWSVALAADTTNGGLKVTFTGAALTTIRTVAKLETTEVTY